MGAVDTTYTFTATDTITSTKMNNIIDQTTMTGDAIIGTTLEVASGKLKVRAAGITSNEMANNSVVTASIADSNVTTAKIADSNITPEKLSGAQTGSAPIYGVRAWGRFSGGTSPSKLAGGNISTVSRTSIGEYTITYLTPVPTDSAVVASPVVGVIFILTSSTTSTNIRTVNTSGVLIDPATFNLIVIG